MVQACSGRVSVLLCDDCVMIWNSQAGIVTISTQSLQSGSRSHQFPDTQVALHVEHQQCDCSYPKTLNPKTLDPEPYNPKPKPMKPLPKKAALQVQRLGLPKPKP